MSNKRILSVEYIRGIAMLGVIGIHTGAYSLSNPYVNKHLFVLLEILTRFSVPIFFFVSAFGLFKSHNLCKPLNYSQYFGRRIRTVFIPYIVWSLIYMAHTTLVNPNTNIWSPPLIYQIFLFGLASYQLYFLVILVWFYTLIPLWRYLLNKILNDPIRNFLIILSLQILFNYYSSYYLTPNFTNEYLNIAVEYRFSYWVIHYVFIFISGAFCAVQYDRFKPFVKRFKHSVTTFFLMTVLGMMYYYYHLLYCSGYSPEEAVNTVHQLSPIGVLYTFASTLFLFMILDIFPIHKTILTILGSLSEHSYAIYLVHPLVMYYLTSYLAQHNLVMTGAITIAFYFSTVGISFILALLVKRISQFVPLVGLLLTGSMPNKKTR